MLSLDTQPNLDEAASSQRFKGYYLLESVKVKITDTGWPVRVATIKDIQDHNALELRLLGNNFLAINYFVGDYVQLEAALTRYRNGTFFYLAWYEPVTGLLIEQNATEENVVNQISRESCLEFVRQRLAFVSPDSDRSFCISLLKNFSQDLSTHFLRSVCKRLPQLDDNQLIVELIRHLEKQSDDLSSTGKLLHQLHNKEPYRIWEQSLLGQ